MRRHDVLIRVSVDEDSESGPFTDQDVIDAVKATLHEIYPVADWPIVPLIRDYTPLGAACDRLLEADEPDEREEAIAAIWDAWA